MSGWGLSLRRLDRRGLGALYRAEIKATFPPAERKPLAAMERLLRAGVYDPLGLYRGAALCGYALLWRDGASGVVLLDYLGVCRAQRGRGVGSAMLGLLLEHYAGRTLLVEAEAPEAGAPQGENALRERRLAFYRRAGFRRLPYEARIFGVRYAMLSGGAACSPQEAMAAHIRLYRSEFPPPVYRSKVLIPSTPEAHSLGTFSTG